MKGSTTSRTIDPLDQGIFKTVTKVRYRFPGSGLATIQLSLNIFSGKGLSGLTEETAERRLGYNLAFMQLRVP